MRNADERVAVVIADDHPLFRKGLRTVIDADSRLVLVGEAADGREALAAIEEKRPRVAVLDLNMPRMTGIEVAEAVVARRWSVGIIFLTMYEEEPFFEKALTLGVNGYLLKDTAAADIVRCILAVAGGEVFFSPRMAAHAVKQNRRFAEGSAAAAELLRLSPSELRVLRLIAEYKSTEQIALELYISPKTVENHRLRICHKLGLSGHNALLRWAIEHRSLL